MKTVYFDFFNVLSDGAYERVLKKYFPADQHDAWASKSRPLDLGELSEKEVVCEMSRVTGVEEAAIWAIIDDGSGINHELLDFIKTNLKGKYAVGILSNAPSGVIQRRMGDKLNMFDIVLISGDLKMVKPEQPIFQHAILKSGHEAEDIVFVDDRQENIDAAKEAGMRGILYTDFPTFRGDITQYL